MGVLALSFPNLTKDPILSDEKNVWRLNAEKNGDGVGRSRICKLS